MVLLSVLVISFVEKSLRAGKAVKWIEQSTQAYYLATTIIEEKLNNSDLKKQPWNIATTNSTSVHNLNSYSGSKLEIAAIWSVIPDPWKWNSPFDKDFNIISLNKPIQLMIPKGITFEQNTKMLFRIPKITSNVISSTLNNEGYIYFSLWNSEKVFYLKDKGQLIKSDDIKNSHEGDFNNAISINDQEWFFYDSRGQKQTSLNLKDFYEASDFDCWNDTNIKCTLKFSLLKPVQADNKEYPFLEYKMQFNKAVPLQFMTLNAMWWEGKYARTRQVEIPQITTNTALDFAVLQ